MISDGPGIMDGFLAMESSTSIWDADDETNVGHQQAPKASMSTTASNPLQSGQVLIGIFINICKLSPFMVHFLKQMLYSWWCYCL